MQKEQRVALAGAVATACAVGYSRFAYVPILPAMVATGLLTRGHAGVAGAMNLAGYVLGVFSGRPLTRRIPTARALDFGMFLSALAFAACSLDLGIGWFAAARFVAGVSGGVLMTVAGPAVQAEVDPSRRGRASGTVLAGIGAGAAVVALLVPWLLTVSVRMTWIGLCVLTLVSWALAARDWPRASLVSAKTDVVPPAGRGLLITYGLAGVGITSTYLYTLELAVRSRGMSLLLVAIAWTLFGLGGVLGSVYGGRLCDLRGSTFAIRLGVAAHLVGLVVIIVPHPAAHVLASFILGVAATGTVGCALACSREIAGPAASILWSRATAAYAVAQAGSAFGLAAIYAHTGSTDTVFAISIVPTILALIAAFTMMRTRDKARELGENAAR